MMFIDGNFETDSRCEFHCYPTCHPAQFGPNWKYGCTHKAWPQNRRGDFVPIVECGGDPAKCELVKSRCWSRYKGGLKRRIKNCQAKMGKLVHEKHGATKLEASK